MCDILDAVVNEEQMLDFALSHICERDTDTVHEVADAILTCYIVHDYRKQNLSFNEDDITSKIKELIADYTLSKLAREELVDVVVDEDGQIVYKLTEKGRNKINDSSI